MRLFADLGELYLLGSLGKEPQQQMQWTPKGAHLLLQVRMQVLNEDWDKTFRKWYPGFRPVQTPSMELSMVA